MVVSISSYSGTTPVEPNGASRGRAKSEKEMERQRKLLAEGRCIRCRATRNTYAKYCDDCMVKVRQRQRRRLGCKPWKPGKAGRPPKVVEGDTNAADTE